MDGDTDPLSQACLIVAHPDDELMWFSSVLQDMDQIVFCFANSPSFPGISRGRASLIDAHPSRNIKTLGLTEAEVYDRSHWPEPETSTFGLKPDRSRSASSQRYIENYALLETHLESILQGYRNVYTHSPWGEYGHEEHVQVFRAVDSCRKNLGFSMWCPNYVSSRSHNLMTREVRRLSNSRLDRATDSSLQCELYQLYLEHGAWTWPTDMSDWFPSESMFLVSDLPLESHKPRTLPMNYIDMAPPNPGWRDRSLRQLGNSISRRIWPRPKSEE